MSNLIRVRPWSRGWLPGCLLFLLCLRAHAGPLVTTDQPISFFTNLASRVLSSQLGLDLNHLQVYPTNQYTPAVHRLLQVTANLYDAATNRPVAGDYPYLPTVFRPLFRQDTNGGIFIAGYREVSDDTVANFTGSGPPNVVLGVNQGVIPAAGMDFMSDALEPTVVGVPLVVAARKGLPNFNEFAMQTSALVYRKLQFQRAPGSNTGPIVQTNQMLLVSITNTCGVEAWNSYLASYPRNLEMRLDAVMVATVTNDYGNLLLSNAVPLRPLPAAVAANTWAGFNALNPSPSAPSFRALLSSFLFFTNSMYSQILGEFVPPTNYETGIGFPVPHWYLGLRPMLRFALVDVSVSPARVVDYVSLDSSQVPVEMSALLSLGAVCSTPYAPDGSPGSMWCTNRLADCTCAPTFGIINQLGVALGNVSSTQWQATAHAAEVDFFRAQFGLSSLFYPTGTFSQTNTFVCPFSAVRMPSFYTSWQANDPLVHYTIPDLTDGLSSRPSYELDTTFYSPLGDLGGLDVFTGLQVGGITPLNPHYRPWLGNPNKSAETTPPTNCKLGLKDPLVLWSDNWAFPTNAQPDLSWLGQVHRGTPWQSIYLKSTAIDLPTWMAWTGDTLLAPGQPFTFDAAFSHPTNDWHITSLLISLLSTNDPRTLLSVNETSVAAWESAFDGVVAITNTAPDSQLRSSRGYLGQQFAALVLQSNSPQASLISGAIATARSGQTGQRFGQIGDLLTTPELSVASPFLNQGSATNPFVLPAVYTYQQTYGLGDAAYEAIPTQLLLRLRPDSVASFISTAGPVQVQFTGADGYAYAVQVSSNLVDWTCVATNYPANGVFTFQEPGSPAGGQRFYRSVLLP